MQLLIFRRSTTNKKDDSKKSNKRRPTSTGVWTTYGVNTVLLIAAVIVAVGNLFLGSAVLNLHCKQ